MPAAVPAVVTLSGILNFVELIFVATQLPLADGVELEPEIVTI